MEKLSGAFTVLVNKKSEMRNFFMHYMCESAGFDFENFVDSEMQFLRFIDFCLHTRQRPVNSEYAAGMEYFNNEYSAINRSISDSDLSELKRIVYNAPGVGQKIGSLIIEMIFLYSKYENDELLKEAFLPIDTHTERILRDSFGLEVPYIGSPVDSRRFLRFQEKLNNYTSEGKSRVYFDYLWFVGKMFCSKITDSKYREPL